MTLFQLLLEERGKNLPKDEGVRYFTYYHTSFSHTTFRGKKPFYKTTPTKGTKSGAP